MHLLQHAVSDCQLFSRKCDVNILYNITVSFYNVNDVYLPILLLSYTCNLYGLNLYYVSM